jgi:hypothetical protein
MGLNLTFHIMGRMQTECVRDEGAEEHICSEDGGSKMRMEKSA